jgi:hypothetical protein
MQPQRVVVQRQRLAVDGASDGLLKSPSPRPLSDFSGVHILPPYNVLVDYSALLLPRAPTTAPRSHIPFLALEVSAIDGLRGFLSTIRSQVVDPIFSTHEREIAVQRLDNMQLGAVWIQGQRTAQSLVLSDDIMKRCFDLMGKRGWKDHFVVIADEPYCELNGTGVSNHIEQDEDDEDTDPKGKGKEIQRWRQGSTSTSV